MDPNDHWFESHTELTISKSDGEIELYTHAAAGWYEDIKDEGLFNWVRKMFAQAIEKDERIEFLKICNETTTIDVIHYNYKWEILLMEGYAKK